MKKVTIAMVAEKAGVSRGTVDRVLNNRPHVSPDQRASVMEAIRELNYIPKKAQLAALGETEQEEEKKLLLGVIFPDEGGYIRRVMKQGIRDAFSMLPASRVELITEECDTRMSEEVIEYIKDMQRRGVKGIILRAEKDAATARAVDELAEAGIPVITFNSDLPDCRRACFIGQDPYRSGRVAGELMAKLIRPEDGLIAAIGNLEVDSHQQRLRGFCEVMYRHGFRDNQFHVIETYNDYLLTQRRISELLETHPDIRGIYMANRSVAGCIEAVRRAERTGGMHVIGHDLSESTRGIRQLLDSGEVDFIIAENIYKESYDALTILYQLASTGKLTGETTGFSEISILCAENIGSFAE